MRFLILALLLAGRVDATPLGILNHNPGNISSKSPQAWSGAIGTDSWGHLIFKDDLHGLKAIRRVLKAYWTKHGINTPRKVAKRWISNKASAEEVAQYAKVLCEFTKTGLDDTLDMTDPNILRKLARGIVKGENSISPYSHHTWDKAFPR